MHARKSGPIQSRDHIAVETPVFFPHAVAADRKDALSWSRRNLRGIELRGHPYLHPGEAQLIFDKHAKTIISG